MLMKVRYFVRILKEQSPENTLVLPGQLLEVFMSKNGFHVYPSLMLRNSYTHVLLDSQKILNKAEDSLLVFFKTILVEEGTF